MEALSELLGAASDAIAPVINFMIWAFPVKIYKLDDGDRGVIKTYGRVRDWRSPERGPGVTICFAFEEMAVIQALGGFVDLEEQMIMTADNKLTTIDGMVIYDVINVKQAVLENEDIDEFVRGFCMNAIREHAKIHTLDEIADSEKLLNQLAASVNRKIKKRGVRVQEFMITDLRPHETTLMCDTAKEIAQKCFGGLWNES